MLPDAPIPQPITQADKFQAFIEEARSPLIFGAAGLNAMALREARLLRAFEASAAAAADVSFVITADGRTVLSSDSTSRFSR